MNMTSFSPVEKILNAMSSIDLEGMNHVRLMRRRDTKYVVPYKRLPHILELIQDDYMVFELLGERLQPYETVYFDTPQYKMYLDHHNKRLNRYKVRMRKYMLSDISFLEIKFKNNRGETIKKRVNAEMDVNHLDEDKKVFLCKNSPYAFEDVQPALWNKFSRITLVSKHRPERLTIDLGLHFSQKHMDNDDHLKLKETCIIEVKRDLDAGKSDIIDALKKERLQPTGFSKYCMGSVLTNVGLKQNLFKQRLRSLGLYKFRMA